MQCDESRPWCQKCQSIGKSCPGYSNDWDLAFRSENQVVKLKVHSISRKLTRDPYVTTLDPNLWDIPNQVSNIGCRHKSPLIHSAHAGYWAASHPSLLSAFYTSFPHQRLVGFPARALRESPKQFGAISSRLRCGICEYCAKVPKHKTSIQRDKLLLHRYQAGKVLVV